MDMGKKYNTNLQDNFGFLKIIFRFTIKNKMIEISKQYDNYLKEIIRDKIDLDAISETTDI